MNISSFSQWLHSYKLLGIPNLVGKIKLKCLFHGPKWLSRTWCYSKRKFRHSISISILILSCRPLGPKKLHAPIYLVNTSPNVAFLPTPFSSPRNKFPGKVVENSETIWITWKKSLKSRTWKISECFHRPQNPILKSHHHSRVVGKKPLPRSSQGVVNDDTGCITCFGRISSN